MNLIEILADKISSILMIKKDAIHTTVARLIAFGCIIVAVIAAVKCTHQISG